MNALTRDEFDALLAGAAGVLKTKAAVIAIPGEAILGIEAVARCCAGPGRRFLNLVTGPYGRDFSLWLREGGAEVFDLETPYDETASPEAVAAAIHAFEPDALSYVYAEAVTGGANPVEAIQRAAREAGVMTIIDAVSSVGADPFSMDEWGVDVASLGLQKALLGSNGISFVAMSNQALQWMRQNPRAPKHSILSLPELYDAQREAVPMALSVLEAREALRAFGTIEAMGGVDALTKRHQAMAALVRREARALGYELYQKDESTCTALNTTLLRPDTQAGRAFRGEGIVTPGNGALSQVLLRVNHYGEHCSEADAARALETLKSLL